MTVVDYGPDVAALRRRLEAEVARIEHARFMAAGWQRLARAALNALGDIRSLDDPMDAIREALGEDTGRIEELYAAPGYHIGDRERPSSDWELVDDVRNVKTRRDALLDDVGAARDRAEAAEAEVVRLRSECDRAYHWIRQHPTRQRDHACARCVPGGEIVIDGFVCVPHLAEDAEVPRG